jgi:hypothetical protein
MNCRGDDEMDERNRKRLASGRLVQEFSDDMFVNAVGLRGRATPAEIAKDIGCAPRYASVRLAGLLKAGVIGGEKSSGRWIYEYGNRHQPV